MGEKDSNFHIQTSVFLGQEEDDCVLSGWSYLSAAVLQCNYGGEMGFCSVSRELG